MARISLIARVVKTTLSYLFTGLTCLAYALALQVIFEWARTGLRWQTLATLAGASLLAATLRYLYRLLEGPAPEPSPRSRKLKMTAVGVAAALPVAMLCYLLSVPVIATGAGQWQQMTLTDGTNVNLDARSRIVVEYSDAARLVRLYQGGAVFDVVKDPQRPFIVRTSSVDATAVGTRFGVAIDAGVVTTVSEGTVRVTGRTGVDSPAVSVNANQELRVLDRSPTSPQLIEVDAERTLDRASGWLELNGLTVAQAIEEFNHRNRVQIVLDSPYWGRGRYNGYARLRLDSPESLATLIARWSGTTMTVDKQNDVIRLSE